MARRPRRPRRRLRRGRRPPAVRRRDRGPPARRAAPRRLEGVAHLPPRARGRAVPVQPVRRRQLRLLRHAAVGHPRAARAVEARRGRGRGRRSARRSASSTSARHFPPEHKAHMDRLVGWLVEAYRVDIEHARVDVARDPPSGRSRSSTSSRPRSATPTAGATTRRSTIDRDDLLGSVRRAAAFEVDRNLAKIGAPDRPRRVAHDPADGQRLLQPRHERDRLPGGDPALAVLRPRGRRRRELRRHRRGHRPRDRPRLRRPGQPLRRRRQPRRLVDRGRPRRASTC